MKYLWIVIAAIVLLGGGYFFLQSQSNTPTQQSSEATGESVSKDGVAIIKKKIATNENDEDVLKILITGDNFRFQPAVINAEVGQTIIVQYENIGGLHSFVIDELDVDSGRINTDESETLEFTVVEAGEYAFYCSVPGHRQNGMEGVLIVK